MGTLTVTAKGQVTLRKEILEHLGVGPGQRLSVDKLPDGRIEVRAAPGRDITALFGLLRQTNGRTLTVAQMNEITRQGWSGGKRK